jgi:hypothetical protein
MCRCKSDLFFAQVLRGERSFTVSNGQLDLSSVDSSSDMPTGEYIVYCATHSHARVYRVASKKPAYVQRFIEQIHRRDYPLQTNN